MGVWFCDAAGASAAIISWASVAATCWTSALTADCRKYAEDRAAARDGLAICSICISTAMSTLASSGTSWFAIIAMLSMLPRAAISESSPDADDDEDESNGGNWETEVARAEVADAEHALLSTADEASDGNELVGLEMPLVDAADTAA